MPTYLKVSDLENERAVYIDLSRPKPSHEVFSDLCFMCRLDVTQELNGFELLVVNYLFRLAGAAGDSDFALLNAVMREEGRPPFLHFVRVDPAEKSAD